MKIPSEEILDRVRRIETRLTKVGNHLGIDVGGSKPRWDATDQIIEIDSPNCSVADLRKAIPSSFDGFVVPIYIGREHYMTLQLDP